MAQEGGREGGGGGVAQVHAPGEKGSRHQQVIVPCCGVQDVTSSSKQPPAVTCKLRTAKLNSLLLWLVNCEPQQQRLRAKLSLTLPQPKAYHLSHLEFMMWTMTPSLYFALNSSYLRENGTHIQNIFYIPILSKFLCISTSFLPGDSTPQSVTWTSICLLFHTKMMFQTFLVFKTHQTFGKLVPDTRTSCT